MDRPSCYACLYDTLVLLIAPSQRWQPSQRSQLVLDALNNRCFKISMLFIVDCLHADIRCFTKHNNRVVGLQSSWADVRCPYHLSAVCPPVSSCLRVARRSVTCRKSSLAASLSPQPSTTISDLFPIVSQCSSLLSELILSSLAHFQLWLTNRVCVASRSFHVVNYTLMNSLHVFYVKNCYLCYGTGVQ